MFNRPPRKDAEEQPELKITMLNEGVSPKPEEPAQHRKSNRKPSQQDSSARSYSAPYEASAPNKERPQKKAPGKKQMDFAAKKARSERPMTEGRIRNISEFQLSQRDYTTSMMRSMLQRRAFAWLKSLDENDRAEQEAIFQDNVEKRIKELVDAGLIDDARYATLKVRSMRASGKGARRIQLDLLKKGLDEHLIQDAIKEVDAENIAADDEDITAVESERTAAETLARKKKIGPYRTKPAPTDHAGKTKLWRREAGVLSRAGYGLDIIREILDREPEDDVEW